MCSSAESKRGSSPRARGTERAHDLKIVMDRFIPASAGNGNAMARSVRRMSVHPRERGERGELDALT